MLNQSYCYIKKVLVIIIHMLYRQVHVWISQNSYLLHHQLKLRFLWMRNEWKHVGLTFFQCFSSSVFYFYLCYPPFDYSDFSPSTWGVARGNENWHKVIWLDSEDPAAGVFLFQKM